MIYFNIQQKSSSTSGNSFVLVKIEEQNGSSVGSQPIFDFPKEMKNEQECVEFLLQLQPGENHSISDENLRSAVEYFREEQADSVMQVPEPMEVIAMSQAPQPLSEPFQRSNAPAPVVAGSTTVDPADFLVGTPSVSHEGDFDGEEMGDRDIPSTQPTRLVTEGNLTGMKAGESKVMEFFNDGPFKLPVFNYDVHCVFL